MCVGIEQDDCVWVVFGCVDYLLVEIVQVQCYVVSEVCVGIVVG